VASGEFGRTPMMNRQGGRGHWPGVWTVLLAGAGIPGGQIIGASDAWGGCPHEQPIRADRLATFIQSILGLTASTYPSSLSA